MMMTGVDLHDMVRGSALIALAMVFMTLVIAWGMSCFASFFGKNGRYQMGQYDMTKSNPAIPVIDTQTGEIKWVRGWVPGDSFSAWDGKQKEKVNIP